MDGLSNRWICKQCNRIINRDVYKCNLCQQNRPLIHTEDIFRYYKYNSYFKKKYNLIFYRAREAEDFFNNWDPVTKVKNQDYDVYYQTCSMPACSQQIAIFPSNYRRSIVFSKIPMSFYRYGYYYNSLTHINIHYSSPLSRHKCGNHESSQSSVKTLYNPDYYNWLFKIL